MVTATANEAELGRYVVLYGVDWVMYEKILDAIGDRQIRLTYNRGALEIMTLSWDHEWWTGRVDQLVNAACMELDIDMQGGGSTTFRRQDLDRGLEPDRCYYFGANAYRMAGQRELDLSRDPPPDLALEVDISRHAVDRLEIYAALDVSEVWRCQATDIRFLHLRRGVYVEATQSLNFPFLTVPVIRTFLLESAELIDSASRRLAARWAREVVRPLWEAMQKKGRRSGPRKGRNGRGRRDVE